MPEMLLRLKMGDKRALVHIQAWISATYLSSIKVLDSDKLERMDNGGGQHFKRFFPQTILFLKDGFPRTAKQSKRYWVMDCDRKMRIRVRAAAPVSLGSSQSADIYHISQLCTITFYILQILHHHQIGWRVLPHSSIFLGYVSWGCSLHKEFTYTGWVIRCSLRKGAAQ